MFTNNPHDWEVVLHTLGAEDDLERGIWSIEAYSKLRNRGNCSTFTTDPDQRELLEGDFAVEFAEINIWFSFEYNILYLKFLET